MNVLNESIKCLSVRRIGGQENMHVRNYLNPGCIKNIRVENPKDGRKNHSPVLLEMEAMAITRRWGFFERCDRIKRNDLNILCNHKEY